MEVDKETFHREWENTDNQNVMWAEGRRFSHTLTDEELRDVFVDVMRYVLPRHDSSKQKLTSSLVHFTKLRCIDAYHRKLKHSAYRSLNDEAHSLIEKPDYKEDFHKMSFGDSVLYDFYVCKLPVKEIAQKHHVDIPFIRSVLRKGTMRKKNKEVFSKVKHG